MSEQRLKVGLELHIVGDGRTYLNYWNARNGDDVVVEVKDGKLIYDDGDGDTPNSIEITLQEFIDKVKSKFEESPKG